MLTPYLKGLQTCPQTVLGFMGKKHEELRGRTLKGGSAKSLLLLFFLIMVWNLSCPRAFKHKLALQ